MRIRVRLRSMNEHHADDPEGDRHEERDPEGIDE